jgi:hypothetical protein
LFPITHYEALEINYLYEFRTLFTQINSNAKITKSNKVIDKYIGRILHLAPAKLSGFEVCPARSQGCTKACLHTAGGQQYQSVKNKARIARTQMFFKDRLAFKVLLTKEIQNHVNYAKRLKKKPAVRLNGTSDIVWENIFPEIFTMFPQVQFYDYTKIFKRMSPDWSLPKNYYLLFSQSETQKSIEESKQVLDWNKNVAIVIKGFGYGQHHKPLPDNYDQYKLVDGDKHDFRFLDPQGVIVGLRAKGKAYNKSVFGFAKSITILKND